MRSLIIGRGEVGTALAAVIPDSETYDITDDAMPNYDTDVLHIAMPYFEGFVEEVERYMEIYKPQLVIVYSSVPIGTCESISMSVVHSPIEGVHPHLAQSIRHHVRWIGCADEDANLMAAELWMDIVEFGVQPVKSSRYTEFLKLRSTAKYGINLAFTDYEADVAKFLGMKFDLVKRFDQDYNALYLDLGMPQYQRYILNPPNGKIGGHCVVPNAELLDRDYSSPLLKLIKEKA